MAGAHRASQILEVGPNYFQEQTRSPLCVIKIATIPSVMKVNRRRMRHLLARTLSENFFLFFSLSIIQVDLAATNPHAKPIFILTLLLGSLGCGLMAVLRFICLGVEWCEDKGILKESRTKLHQSDVVPEPRP
jgi:hypothetical protein